MTGGLEGRCSIQLSYWRVGAECNGEGRVGKTEGRGMQGLTICPEPLSEAVVATKEERQAV